MLIQLRIKNYRSYKNDTFFSLIGNSSDQKKNNFYQDKSKKGSVKILKSAIIYGPNASGKSNIIKAIKAIRNFVVRKPRVDESIKSYDPFLFDFYTKNDPIEFELTFIGPKNIKYNFYFKFGFDVVLEEKLSYFPKGRQVLIYKRKPFNEDSTAQVGIMGESFNKKKISVFKNQLILSKFGYDEPDDLLTDVFLYFENIRILDPSSPMFHQGRIRLLGKRLFNDEETQKSLNKLIEAADTKINDIDIIRVDDELEGGDFLKRNLRLFNSEKYALYANHKLFKDEKSIDTVPLTFREESVGTQALYALGADILKALKMGSVVAVDELDTSLHPFLTKMIVMIFHSEKLNPKNAQLIFTTHDVSLLDRDLIRKDQVWIAEKNEKGESDLYSLQDFEGLREDTPFEKWYLAGKFGGLPSIKSVDAIFD